MDDCIRDQSGRCLKELNPLVKGRYDLLPPNAIHEVARRLAHGLTKYAEWGWLKLETKYHIDAALRHIFCHLKGMDDENHLAAAATQVLMALEKHMLERGAGCTRLDDSGTKPNSSLNELLNSPESHELSF